MIAKRIIKESIDDDYLVKIAKWGLTGEYSHSGCMDNNNIEEAINCAVSDFKIFLDIPYPKELGNIPEKPIIYRLVRLKNIDELNRDNLGYSWFSNKEQINNPK